jgi:ribose transport system permease protein
VVGLTTALLVTISRINSIIAPFGVTILIQGAVQWKTHGNSIVEGIPTGLTVFGGAEFVGIPLVAWSALALALMIYYLLRQTPYGRYLYAIGPNREAARLVGIRVQLLTGSAFVIGARSRHWAESCCLPAPALGTRPSVRALRCPRMRPYSTARAQ